MISCIGARQRGQAIPLLLLARSDTTRPQHSYSLLSRQFATNPTVSLCPRKLSRIRSAMPIRHYLQGHRFDPETARLLGVAFEMALVTPPACGRASCPDPRRSRPKIIELAKAGERDPERLCDGALKATMLISNPSPPPPPASPRARRGS